LSIFLIFLPTLGRPTKVRVQKREKNLDLKLLYFAFLGLGFMFVEVSLVQKMILPLEMPSYAVAAVLASILVSSGIGSLVSHRVPALRTPSIAIMISILVMVYSLLLPFLSGIISPHPMVIKFLLVFFILLPLGLLMGIPFPVGLKILGESDETLIPWAWAINGCLSVLAPLLAIMLAMAMGFRSVLWAGAGAYLLAFLTSFSLLPRSSEQKSHPPSVQC
jgi:hypothetical protein